MMQFNSEFAIENKTFDATSNLDGSFASGFDESCVEHFDSEFKTSDENIKCSFDNECSFTSIFDSVYDRIVSGDVYTGKTDIIPKADVAQTLDTMNKIVLTNIVVEKIPYYETSNDYGETVYIGG